MFADDCLLYQEICSINGSKILQGDLDSLQAWGQDWLIELNLPKCEAITFTKKMKPMKAECKLHDVILAFVTSAKYLGVHVSSKLSWNTHDDITAKISTDTQLHSEKLQLLSSTHP